LCILRSPASFIDLLRGLLSLLFRSCAPLGLQLCLLLCLFGLLPLLLCLLLGLGGLLLGRVVLLFYTLALFSFNLRLLTGLISATPLFLGMLFCCTSFSFGLLRLLLRALRLVLSIFGAFLGFTALALHSRLVFLSYCQTACFLRGLHCLPSGGGDCLLTVMRVEIVLRLS
jgi:hypothetical protein